MKHQGCGKKSFPFTQKNALMLNGLVYWKHNKIVSPLNSIAMKKVLLLTTILMNLLHLSAQNVGIGTTAPNSSAKLDVQSNNSGILLPRLTSVERKAISNPARGLLLFDTDYGTFFFYDGTNWVPMGFTTPGALPPVAKTASDPAMSRSFGISVSVWKDWMAVGSVGFTNGAFVASGAVYIFHRAADGSWNETQKLLVPDPDYYDRFGFSLDLDSNYLVVGAPGKKSGALSNYGKAYIFKYNGSSWAHELSLSVPGGNGGDEFGWDVAISSFATGVVAVVGVPYSDLNGLTDRGLVYTYRKNIITNNWISISIQPSDPAAGDRFGWSVDVDSALMVIGAPFKAYGNAANAGAWYAYAYNGLNWVQDNETQYAETGSNGAYSISIWQEKIAIGYPYASTPSNGGVAIRMYSRSGPGTYALFEQISFPSTTIAAGKHLGMALSLHGDYLFTSGAGGMMNPGGGQMYSSGISGTAYLFRKDAAGGYSLMNQYQNVLQYTNDLFGNAVAIDGSTYVIGSPKAEPQGIMGAGEIRIGKLE